MYIMKNDKQSQFLIPFLEQTSQKKFVVSIEKIFWRARPIKEKNTHGSICIVLAPGGVVKGTSIYTFVQINVSCDSHCIAHNGFNT